MHGTDGNHASRAGRNTGQHAIVGVGGAQAGRSARGCAQQQKPARSPARHLPSQRDEGDRRFHNRDHPNTPKAGRQDFLAEALVPGQAGEQPIADLRPSHRNHYIADRARCGIIKRSMRQLRLFWRSVFDVRPGEGWRALFTGLHMTCVLFAYYILKPVSRALFVNTFDMDQLPYLYILIAVAGGMPAYAYPCVAVRRQVP